MRSWTGGTGSAGSARTGFCAQAARPATANPPTSTLRRESRFTAPTVGDQPAMARSGWGSDLLVWYGPSTAAPYGLVSSRRATALTSSRVTVVDQLQCLVDASVLAVVQLAAADAVHPRAGVLETEHQPAAHGPLGDPALGFGDPVAGHRRQHVGGHPGDLGEALGQARGIDRQRAAVGEGVHRRIHRVGQPARFANLLEQARTQAAAERGVEHGQRPPMLPVPARHAYPERHVGLLGVAVDHLQGGQASHPAGALAVRHRGAIRHQVRAEVFAHQAHHLVVVDVARDRNHHPFRRVAADVERMQLRLASSLETEATLPITGRPTGCAPKIAERNTSPSVSSGSSSRMAISSSTTARSSSTSSASQRPRNTTSATRSIPAPDRCRARARSSRCAPWR